MLSGLLLTDMETCYKVFRREVIQAVTLEEDRFGIEPEMTLKIARIRGIRIFEVPISYSGRTYEEGKKIGLKDAFRACFVLGKYGIWQRPKAIDLRLSPLVAASRNLSQRRTTTGTQHD